VSRGKIIAAVVALLVVGLVVLAVALSAQSRVPQVSTAEVQKENLTQTVTASGQLEGDVKADVFPGSQGTIKSIAVSDGQQVKVGQILATLDPEPLDVAVAQALSGFKQAQSALVQARRSGPSSAQRASANAAVSAAAASVDAAAAAYDAAAAQFDFLVSIHAPETSTTPAAIAKKQAFAALQQARSGLAQAKAGRDALKSQSAAIAAAQSGVDAAAEALELAKQNRRKATLTAPIDGVVVFAGGGGSASAAGGAAAAALAGAGGGKPAPGSAVTPGSAPFTVFQLGALNFDAQVDEADISNVAVGMKGSVTLDAFPGVTFDTTVVQVKTQAIQTSTGGTAFPVLLSLKNTGKRLLVGMGGNADIEVSGIEGAVTVPVEAIFDEAGGSYVYVIDAKNVVHRTKVKTGVMTDTRAQIRSGVEPGQRVALGGLSNLKDGMTVRVK
jgi:HlyD family secretion protein